MRNIVLAVIAVVIIAIGGAVFYMFSNLDGLVKTAIETIGTKVAGVPVRLSSVAISLTDGKASLKGLSVANPSGFKTPTAFALGEITVAIDTASVTKNPVVIKEVTIVAPEVTYELGGSGSNIDAIQKNVQSFTASQGGAKEPAKAATPAPAADKDGQDAKKLVIDLLQLKDGKVTLATPLPGGKATTPLPDIKLTNIGKASNGATGAEIAGQVLDAVSKTALKAVTSLGIGNLVNGLTGAVGGAGGAAGGAASGGLNAVKGLLGK